MSEKPALFTSSSGKRVARATLKVEREAAALNSQRFPGPTPGGPMRCHIVAIFNDYLQCQSWDGASLGGVNFYVAKPFKLLHVVANYPQLTSLTTVDEQTATATDGSTTETWKVTPSYVVGDEIRAARWGYTGVTVGAEQLSLIDVNNDARYWGVED